MAKGRKTGGRQKGSPNKATKAVKEIFEEAFEGVGGAKALITWAKENLTEFYKLYARLIPVNTQISGSLSVTGLADKLDEADRRINGDR